MSGDILHVENLSRRFGTSGTAVSALAGVSLRVRTGERVAVVGPSGSGKSTLLNLLGLLDTPSAGRYWFDGEDVAGLDADRRARLRNRDIGFVFQRAHLLPGLSAFDNVAMPLHYARLSRAAITAAAEGALAAVGLQARAAHRPHELSGGERQRVAIARAIARAPRLLLADEPTGALDSRTGALVMEVIESLAAAQGFTVLMITHDHAVAARFPRVLRIRDGRLDGDGPG